MKHFVALLLFVFTLTNTNISAQKFYAILAGDFEDDQIGAGCERDIDRIRNEVNTIAKCIGYEPVVTALTRGVFIQENIIAMIENTRSSENDVLLFYFTGHGKNERSSKWPSMKIKDKFQPLEGIHNVLKSRPHKLLITIGDCCNNYKKDRTVAYRKDFKVVKTGNDKTKIYKSLFGEPKGDIIVSSSKPGQYSYNNPLEGSYFTRHLIDNITQAVNYAKELTWEGLLSDTRNKIKNLNFVDGPQEPQFEINLGGKAQAQALLRSLWCIPK